MKDPTINTSAMVTFIYGSMLIVSALTALYLPETANKPLPVTVAQAVSATQRYCIYSYTVLYHNKLCHAPDECVA